MKKFTFKLPIGDWSKDGHEQIEWYRVQANKSVEDAREAYFKAKKKHPKICPEVICCDFEDGNIPAETLTAMTDAGFVPSDVDEVYCNDEDEEGSINPSTAWFADYVVWFLNQGDPDLKAKLIDDPGEPMLQFYGFDEKKRHIGGLGYGLFSR